MRVLHWSYTFPVWVMVLFAVTAVLFAGCQQAPAEDVQPTSSRAADDGIPKPGAPVAAPGGK